MWLRLGEPLLFNSEVCVWPASDSDKPVSVSASPTGHLRFRVLHRRFALSRMCDYMVATDVDVNPD